MRIGCDTLSMGDRVAGKDVIVIMVVSRALMWLYHAPKATRRKNPRAVSVATHPGETAAGDEAAQLGVSRCVAALGMH